MTDQEKAFIMESINKQGIKPINLYTKIKHLIANSDFIPAFLWFVKNCRYDQVKRPSKKRIYQIYKDAISHGNIFGRCIYDDEKPEKHCVFVIDGSNKGIRQFENNYKYAIADELTKYIIASNNIPYLMQYVTYDENADYYCYNAKLIDNTSPVFVVNNKPELCVAILRKICWNHDISFM